MKPCRPCTAMRARADQRVCRSGEACGLQHHRSGGTGVRPAPDRARGVARARRRKPEPDGSPARIAGVDGTPGPGRADSRRTKRKETMSRIHEALKRAQQERASAQPGTPVSAVEIPAPPSPPMVEEPAVTSPAPPAGAVRVEDLLARCQLRPWKPCHDRMLF